MAQDNIIWKIVLDIAVLGCTALPLLFLNSWVEPFHRGYHIGDHSLSLPYKSDTVPVLWLGVAGFVFNITTILIIEVVRQRLGKNGGDKFICGSLIPGWVWESYTTIGIFTFGAAAQQTFVTAAKFVIGRLRPHFFYVCRPTPASPTSDAAVYIIDYECSANTNNTEMLRDMRLSFPSAHSSFAMYCAVFFIFYIQVNGKWRGSKLLRHAVQFGVLMTAWWVGLSRISDHKHHWSDVAVGYLVGTATAVLVFVFVLKPKQYGFPLTWQENLQPPNMLPRAVLVQ